MDLTLVRYDFTDKSTIGKLAMNGIFECFTLEDVVRDVKIPGKTAIPYGRYEVVITYSNRFKYMLPLLLNVPGFDGIRIHPGNTAEDTEGCILVGQSRGTDEVLHSRAAFGALFRKLDEAAVREKIWIEVTK